MSGMYCPKCGAEANEGQSYCRKCGVNLALVGKAVSVGEVIARGDSGLLPRVRVMMGNLKLDEVSEQVARHVETLGREVERSVREHQSEIDAVANCMNDKPKKKTKDPAQQRADLLGKGFGSLFGGIAMAIVFYVIARQVPFNFPPEWIAKVPFDLYALVSLAWLFGLIPALSGLGQVIGALMIGSKQEPPAERRPNTAPLLDPSTAEQFYEPPPSVTEHTTAQLDYDRVPVRPDSRATGRAR
jgi:hypothetical protein